MVVFYFLSFICLLSDIFFFFVYFIVRFPTSHAASVYVGQFHRQVLLGEYIRRIFAKTVPNLDFFSMWSPSWDKLAIVDPNPKFKC